MISTIFALALAATTSTYEPAVFVDRPKYFSCTPKVIRPGMRLVLRKSEPTMDELGVSRVPANDSFGFLVYEAPDSTDHLLMTNEQFAGTKVLQLDVSRLHASYQGNKYERVFTKAGRYRFYVSDNLESENGGFRCTVTYKP